MRSAGARKRSARTRPSGTGADVVGDVALRAPPAGRPRSAYSGGNEVAGVVDEDQQPAASVAVDRLEGIRSAQARRRRPAPVFDIRTPGETRTARGEPPRHDRSCRRPPASLAKVLDGRPRLPARPAPLDAAPIAFLALVGGAMAMGISPVFVRFAEVGPFTSAFWRVGLALPALWLWSALERRADADPRRTPRRASRSSLAGLFFAGDLTFWHLAIMNTSVANATFLATLAPVWVVLGSGLFLGETRRAEGVSRPRAVPRRRGRADRRHLVGQSRPARRRPLRLRHLVLLRRLFPRRAARAARLRRGPHAVPVEPRDGARAARRGGADRGHDVAADALRRRGARRAWRWSAMPADRACSPSRSAICRRRSRRW